MSQSVPAYVEGHNLLRGKTVLITAAAGTGIGFAVAKRCLEEGAAICISDIHERRLGEAVEELAKVLQFAQEHGCLQPAMNQGFIDLKMKL